VFGTDRDRCKTMLAAGRGRRVLYNILQYALERTGCREPLDKPDRRTCSMPIMTRFVMRGDMTGLPSDVPVERPGR
jgi:hypothetical protein